jgi:hypothetical protein
VRLSRRHVLPNQYNQISVVAGIIVAAMVVQRLFLERRKITEPLVDDETSIYETVRGQDRGKHSHIQPTTSIRI